MVGFGSSSCIWLDLVGLVGFILYCLDIWLDLVGLVGLFGFSWIWLVWLDLVGFGWLVWLDLVGFGWSWFDLVALVFLCWK